MLQSSIFCFQIFHFKRKIIFFRMLSAEEAKERLEDADDNGDEKITWDEYIKDTYGLDDSQEYQIDEQVQERNSLKYVLHFFFFSVSTRR